MYLSENIFKHLSDVLREWNIDSKVNVAVRDNAQNMVAAFNQPDCTISSIECQSHSLQLVIEDPLFAMASVKNLCYQSMCEFAKKFERFSDLHSWGLSFEWTAE